MTKQRISKSTIKSIVNSPASATKEFVWDTEVRGFGVYKTSEGVPTFVYQYWLTKVNWNSTQMNQRLPIPIQAARKVGEVLKYMSEDQAESSDFRKYI